MSRTVTALYTTLEEAEGALVALRSEVALDHAEIYDRTPARAAALDELDLTPEERASCERALETSEFMLLARVRSGEDPDHIVTILERIAAERASGAGAAPSGLHSADELRLGGEDAPQVAAEERIPVVEEELRVGTREVVRGGARVRTRVEEVPVHQEVELVEENTNVERRPVTRFLNEAELEQAGLLRERVIEVAQIREEAVVTKEAFVREEVVVTKTLERRVEQIHETVRRTEVETDRIEGPGDRALFGTREQDEPA